MRIERIEKGSREGIEKRERQLEGKEGLRDPPTLFLEFSRSDTAM